MRIQEKAEALGAQVFLGVPVASFEAAGREHLIHLLARGLRPDSKVVELGCGVLRIGYWLVHFLDPSCYCGIEPHAQRLAMGTQAILEKQTLEAKRPRFDRNPDFDTSVFDERFDFFFAYSIWTHASKAQIRKMLDAFLRDSRADGVFLTTYLPANDRDADYQGEHWHGTSHESNVVGWVHHARDWIDAECERRALVVRDLGRDNNDGQSWLEITRRGSPRAERSEDIAVPSGGPTPWPWSETRRMLDARLADAEDRAAAAIADRDRAQLALAEAARELAALKRSRLLRLERRLRRIVGLSAR